jgi:hypothetical protein
MQRCQVAVSVVRNKYFVISIILGWGAWVIECFDLDLSRRSIYILRAGDAEICNKLLNVTHFDASWTYIYYLMCKLTSVNALKISVI